MEPYLKMRDGNRKGNDRFEGFMPDFLKALRDRKAIPADYKLQLVKDGLFGHYDPQQNRWVGMVGEVMKQGLAKASVADLAAGPIAISPLRQNIVDFSKVWANVSLVLVSHKDNGFTSVQEVIDSTKALGGIDGGSSLKAIAKNSSGFFPKMWAKIESDPTSKVANVTEGIERARFDNYTMILESHYADYIVNKHCELVIVGESFLPQPGYAFALTKGSSLKTELDKGIEKMINDGSLKRLRDRWWNQPCVSGQPQIVTAVSTIFMAMFVVMATILTDLTS